MATKIQIRETAAENLGILGEGETLPSYEASDLDQSYLEVYAVLQGLELTSWASSANIPDQYASSVAMLVAANRATKYQIPDNRYQRIQLEAFGAMRLIRELQAPTKMGVTEIENY